MLWDDVIEERSERERALSGIFYCLNQFKARKGKHIADINILQTAFCVNSKNRLYWFKQENAKSKDLNLFRNLFDISNSLDDFIWSLDCIRGFSDFIDEYKEELSRSKYAYLIGLSSKGKIKNPITMATYESFNKIHSTTKQDLYNYIHNRNQSGFKELDLYNGVDVDPIAISLNVVDEVLGGIFSQQTKRITINSTGGIYNYLKRHEHGKKNSLIDSDVSVVKNFIKVKTKEVYSQNMINMDEILKKSGFPYSDDLSEYKRFLAINCPILYIPKFEDTDGGYKKIDKEYFTVAMSDILEINLPT
jgi:hypothetical protein